MPVRPHEAREYLRTPEDVAAHLNAATEESDGDPRLLRKVPERRGRPLLQSNLSSRIVQLPKRNPHQNRTWSFHHPAPRLRLLTELSPLATSWSCGDMVGEVDASFMVPSTSSCQHGPPSLIRVRARRYFSPSDSLEPAAVAPVPLASSLPRGGCLFAAGRTRTHRRAALRSLGRRRSQTGLPRGDSGPLKLPGRPLAWVRAPGQPPRRAGRRLTPFLAAAALLPSVVERPLGTRIVSPFEAAIPKPTRLRSYSSLIRVATDGARLATGLPGSAWPGGFRTCWTTYRISERSASLLSTGTGLPSPPIKGLLRAKAESWRLAIQNEPTSISATPFLITAVTTFL